MPQRPLPLLRVCGHIAAPGTPSTPLEGGSWGSAGCGGAAGGAGEEGWWGSPLQQRLQAKPLAHLIAEWGRRRRGVCVVGGVQEGDLGDLHRTGTLGSGDIEVDPGSGLSSGLSTLWAQL